MISDESFKEHHGFDLTSVELEPGDPALPTSRRVLRAKKIGELAAEIAGEKELKDEQVRFWVMVNRQNKTTRPDQPLNDPEMSVEDAYTRFGTKNIHFRLFVEVAPIIDGKVDWPEPQGHNLPILVFLKHFDAVSQTLTGVGHVFVRKLSKVADLAGSILEMMSWPAGTQLHLYEVRIFLPWSVCTISLTVILSF